MAILLSASCINAKTLVVYYSFTNNVHTIVNNLHTQIDADVIRIEPAEKGIDYADNNYAAGSALISAIRNNPDDVASYPAIDPVEVNLDEYDMVIVAAPLWWSQMAAPLQTFLFPAWQGNERQAYRSDCFECQQRYKQCGGRCQTPYPARHFSRA